MNKPSQHSLTILVVEDEPGDFGLIRELARLAHLGHSGSESPVTWAQTLAKGLTEAARLQPDIVLLDLSLPDSTGIATVRKMRAALSDVPIVVLTGHDDNELAVAALEAGAQDYLVKGQLDVDALNRAVRNALVRGALESRLRVLNETLEQRIQEEVTQNREKDLMLIQQSRLATMGEMMHNVAHQWRQPLNTVGLILQNIQADYEDGLLSKESLNNQVSHGFKVIERMSTTIDDFRNFFKPGHEKSRFSLNSVVQDALSLVNASFSNNQITVTVEAPKDIYVEGFPNEYAQVLLNVLTNAKDAIKEKTCNGKIVIWVEDRSGIGIVRVQNNGGTIPEDILPRILDPYFTTKKSGSGIGLYMSSMIMDHMHGHIEVHNLDDGVEAVISVPTIA